MRRTMPPSKHLKARVSEEIRQALEAYCREHDVDKAEVIRRGVCQQIGKPELLETMPPEGRPRKAPAQTAKPPRS